MARSSAWDLGLEGLALLLSFSVLTAWDAFRWSAVFCVVPLLLAFQGAVLMKPSLEPRALTGMGLLLVAAVFLLLPETDAREQE